MKLSVTMVHNKANPVTNLFNHHITRRRHSDSELKASASKLLSKANNSFSNLAAPSISYAEEENRTRRDSFRQVASGAVNKVIGQIQEVISKVLSKNDIDMESATFDDLINTITEDQCLWNEYRSEIRKNNIITNLACKEYLFEFIAENKERIEEQYFTSKSAKENSTNLKKKDSNYFGSAKSLCNLILKPCKDEIVNADQSSNHLLSKPMPENLTCRRRGSTIKKEKYYVIDSEIYLAKEETNKKTSINNEARDFSQDIFLLFPER